MSTTHPYHGQQAALATKHGKLAQIGPALLAAVGLEVIPVDVDTDMFGTFTGEVQRPGDALQTAIAKAQAAAHAGGLTLGIASEGSFGPHPGIPFVAANLEIVVLVDLKLGCHVAEQVLTANTNFAHERRRSGCLRGAYTPAVGTPGRSATRNCLRTAGGAQRGHERPGHRCGDSNAHKRVDLRWIRTAAEALGAVLWCQLGRAGLRQRPDMAGVQLDGTV